MALMKVTFELDIPDDQRFVAEEILSQLKNRFNSMVSNLNIETKYSPLSGNNLTEQLQKDENTELAGEFKTKKSSDQSVSSPVRVLQLPNGMVNKEYVFLLNSSGSEFDKIKIISDPVFFESLSDLGLTFIQEKNQIVGKPSKNGEFLFPIKYKATGDDGTKVIQNGVLKFFINADPISLWKNIPTSDTIEYFKADQVWDFFKIHSKPEDTAKPKSIIAASKRGRSHAHEGRTRDDDYLFHYDNKSGWYFIAVADGAGSVKVSRKGSEIACRNMVEVCRTKLEGANTFEKLISDFSIEKSEEKTKKLRDELRMIISSAILRALKDIEEEAISRNRSVIDYSTTILFTLCKQFNFGWFVASFWVGDGGIGIYNKETQYLKVLGDVDSGEYAGQTCFLSRDILNEEEIGRRLRFEIVNDFSSLILMTDGVSDPKFDSDTNLSDINKWNELWEDLSKSVQFSANIPETAQQLLFWLDFWSPGNHDDRTIAILF